MPWRTFSTNPSSELKRKFDAWLAFNRLQVRSMSFRSGQSGGSHLIQTVAVLVHRSPLFAYDGSSRCRRSSRFSGRGRHAREFPDIPQSAHRFSSPPRGSCDVRFSGPSLHTGHASRSFPACALGVGDCRHRPDRHQVRVKMKFGFVLADRDGLFPASQMLFEGLQFILARS